MNLSNSVCGKDTTGYVAFKDECYGLRIFYFISEWHKYSLTGVVITDFMLIIPTTILNFLIINVIRRKPSLQTASNLLLSGLATSDFFIGLIIEPSKAISTIHVLNCASVCSLYAVVFIMGYYLATVSFLILTMVSIDRYIALTHPFNYQRLTSSNAVIRHVMLFVWIVPLIFIIVSIILRQMRAISLVFTILAPLSIAISITAQVISVRAVQNVRKRDSALSISNSTMEIVSKRRKSKVCEKATKVAGLVLIATIGCYAPHAVLTTIRTLQKDKFAFQGIYDWTKTLVLFNSTMNPIIYCLNLKGIRTKIMQDFIRLKSRFGNASIEPSISGFVTEKNSVEK